MVASGKSTLAKALADKYNLSLISVGRLMRDLARERGISLVELSGIAEKDASIDNELDRRQKELAKGDCAVDSRLGAHILDPDFKIWLIAPLEVRVERTANRDGITNEEALKAIRQREKSERTRYQRFYNIILDDYSKYDLIVNTGPFKSEQTTAICCKAIDALKS